jgi:2-keto-myo-inositol isomerase
MRLAINTACTMPYDIESEIPAIAAAGFEWVELRVPEIRDFLRDRSLGDLRRLLDENGVRVGSINALEYVSFRGSEFGRVCEEGRELFEWAVELGCNCVIAVPSPTPSWQTTWGEIVSESVEAMSAIAAIAEPLGVTVGFEPLGFGWCSVRTVAGACEILDAVRPGNVGLVLDLFHFALGGSRVQELDLIDAARIPIVHIDDVVQRTNEATTDADRVFPGDGDLPIDEVCARLHARGFSGLLSLELFTPEYWAWTPRRIADRGYEATARVAARMAG